MRTFESDHHSWAERAKLGELTAVLSVGASERTNLLLHSVGLFGARIGLASSRKRVTNQKILLDFGCGTGRMVRFFGMKGWSVFGTEVSPEMLTEAQRIGIQKNAVLALTDGISIPLRSASVDLVWICGVLKYSLFPPGSSCRGGSGVLTNKFYAPSYRAIAGEMYRVLKPGGLTVNV